MWLPNPDVLPTDLGDELVLMDTASSVMFSLNEAGRLLWNALPAEQTALSELLRSTYDLPAEVAERDTQALLQALAERGLVRPA